MMTQRQNVDLTPGTDWTRLLILSIGRYVTFDICASHFDAGINKSAFVKALILTYTRGFFTQAGWHQSF